MFKKGSVNRFRKRCSSFLLIFLALMITNSSVDSPDSRYTMVLKNNVYQEDLAKNDIETLYEFVLEILLDWNNAVEEHDDQETNLILKKIDLALPSGYHEPTIRHPFILTVLFKPSLQPDPSKILIDIPYPPPDVFRS